MATTNKLRATDIEGVYVNERGVHCDSRGVAIAFKTLREKESKQRQEVLGHVVSKPHELLWAVANDPRYPLTVRLQCAKDAAPYYAAKMESGRTAGNMSVEETAKMIMLAVRAADSSVGVGRG